MATKKELEEQLKTLKGKLKEALDQLKEATNKVDPDLGDSPQRALGLFYDNGYKFARIDYNPETKSAELVSVEEASKVPDSMDLAKFEFENTVLEEIFNKLGR
jgi:hypothetical protein